MATQRTSKCVFPKSLVYTMSRWIRNYMDSCFGVTATKRMGGDVQPSFRGCHLRLDSETPQSSPRSYIELMGKFMEA